MFYIKKYYKVVTWMLLIFILSSIPNAKISNDGIWDLLIRKTAHITEYFILYILMYQAFKNDLPKHKSITVLVLVALYASSDEFHQRFVQGRGPAIHDVLIDSIGGTLGMLYLKFFWEKTPNFIKRIF